MPPDDDEILIADSATPDWQDSVQKLYDRKSKERRPEGREGDPQRFRQVAAALTKPRSSRAGKAFTVGTTVGTTESGYASLALPKLTGAYPHWRQIVGESFLEHQIVRRDLTTQQVDLFLGRVTWEIFQQFGIEAAYVFMLLLTRSAQAQDPWSEIVELSSEDLLELSIWDWDAEPSFGRRLRLVGNWVELVCNLSLMVSQVDPKTERFTALRIPFWVLEEMEYAGRISATGKAYQPEEARDLTIRVGLGLWHEQFVDALPSYKQDAFLCFCFQAKNILHLPPNRKPIAAKLGILLLLLLRLSPEREYAVGSLLEQVESKAVVIEIQRRTDRRDHYFSCWNDNLHALLDLGWTITFDDATYPIALQPSWKPIAELDGGEDWAVTWLNAKIRIQPPELPPAQLKSRANATLADRITGQHIGSALEMRGLSQAKLAEQLGLDRSMVTYWIKGARAIQPKHRAMICELLGDELQTLVAKPSAG
jgi:Helix-turn-helix